MEAAWSLSSGLCLFKIIEERLEAELVMPEQDEASPALIKPVPTHAEPVFPRALSLQLNFKAESDTEEKFTPRFQLSHTLSKEADHLNGNYSSQLGSSASKPNVST